LLSSGTLNSRYRESHKLLRKDKEWALPDGLEKGIVYGRWGMGFDVYSGSFCIRHFPLKDEGHWKPSRPLTPPSPVFSL